MKYLQIGVVAIVIVLLTVAVVAPIGPLPGFWIGGEATPAPAQWGAMGDVDEVRLQVGEGAIKRVVIIWVVQVDGELYVVGSKESGWVQMLANGGPVKLRIGAQTYDLTASAASEGLVTILTAYADKYRADYPDIVGGFPAPEEMQVGAGVFRLSR